MECPVNRYDFGRLGKAERTPQGGIRVPANLTRAGVFVYQQADGTVRRELRPAEEVFHEDSLATLIGAPVTDLHPAEMVQPGNWRQLTVGHVGEDVHRSDQFVAARLSIQDATAIDAVDQGKRQELSCGYSCVMDLSSGEYNGEKYDAIQRKIRYNHVAIGPPGWGRAGRDVSLRLDSQGAYQLDNEIAAGSPRKPESKKMAKIRIDGIEYDADSPALAQAVAKQEESHRTKISALKKERDELAAKCDAARVELENTLQKLAEATDPKRIENLVSERARLHADAREVLGDEKLDGKTDREIMVLAVKKIDSSFDDSEKSDEYVKAYFAATVKTHRADSCGVAVVRSAAVGAQRSERSDSESAYDRMIKNDAEAWTQPLLYSKGG